MNVRLIAVPYHLGRSRIVLGLGPVRLLEGGAEARLRALGHGVRSETVERRAPFTNEVAAIIELNARLADRIRDARAAGEFPLVLAGDCNSCLGTLAGHHAATMGGGKTAGGSDPFAEVVRDAETMQSAESGEPPGPGVIWFDAHGDFNTPETTTSGFFDGMALAAAVGRCWDHALRGIPGFRAVPEAHVILAGGRALDPPETQLLAQSGVNVVAAEWLAGGRAATVVEAATVALRQALLRSGAVPPRAYLHVDLDVLDSAEGPVNRWSVSGGLTLSELEEAIGRVRRVLPLSAAALTAYEPAVDPEGRALAAGLRVIEALVGGADNRSCTPA